MYNLIANIIIGLNSKILIKKIINILKYIIAIRAHRNNKNIGLITPIIQYIPLN
jgi:hypothetical protein